VYHSNGTVNYREAGYRDGKHKPKTVTSYIDEETFIRLTLGGTSFRRTPIFIYKQTTTKMCNTHFYGDNMEFQKQKYTHRAKVLLKVPVMIEVECTALLEADDHDEAMQMAEFLHHKRGETFKLIDLKLAETQPRDFYREALLVASAENFSPDDSKALEMVRVVDDDGDAQDVPVVYPIGQDEYLEHQEYIVDEEGQLEHQKLQARERELATHGFWGYVTGHDRYKREEESPTGFMGLTQGLPQTMNHPNLQIVIRLDDTPKHEAIKKTFLAAVSLIRERGRVYTHNSVHTDIIPNYPIKFIAAKCRDENVMRMIFPDVNGGLEPHQMNMVKRIQYEKTGYE
jgi:hypothetical protein